MSRQAEIYFLLCLCLGLSSGCRSTPDASCERAIALLRAENIDLENRFYELEARYQSMLAQGCSDPLRDSGYLPNGIPANERWQIQPSNNFPQNPGFEEIAPGIERSRDDDNSEEDFSLARHDDPDFAYSTPEFA